MSGIPVHSFKNPTLYDESGINLDSIMLIQGVRSRTTDNPIRIQDKEPLKARKITVEASDKHVKMWLKDEVLCDFVRTDNMSERDWRSKIDHLRHDYTANMLRGGTDQKLSDFGMRSVLTPDKISKNGKIILELATTISLREDKLEQDYKKKLLNYGDISKENKLMLTILTVSTTHVYTNCHLRYDMVPELCRRVREANSFEMEISKQSGYYPNSFNEDEDENIKKVQDVMTILEDVEKKRSWDFNEDLERESTSECTTADKDIASKIMNKSWKDASKLIKKRDDNSLDEYLKGLRNKETRSDMKRIIPFPCLLPEYTNEQSNMASYLHFSENDGMAGPEFSLAHLWRLGIENGFKEQRENPPNVHYMKSLSEAMSDRSPDEEHKLRKEFSFSDTLTEQEKDYIALSGPGAKLRKEMDEIIDHEVRQKRSFDMSTNTGDIHEFLNSMSLLGHNPNFRDKNCIANIIKKSQKKTNKYNLSDKLFEWCTDLSINRYSHFISELCLELSYEYKTPNKTNQWTCKPMRNYDVLILLKSTGTHTFFSLMTKKDSSQNFETGRLGSSLFYSNGMVFSDFCSTVESTLEHFIKAGPYMTSLSSYLLQHFKIPFIKKRIEVPFEFWTTLKSLFLIYMNNKTDLENLVLDCRFLYMKVLQKFENDPYHFIDRLPSVLRSRLTVYFLEKVINLMKRYRNQKPKQIRVKGLPESDPNSVRITGLRCIFHDAPLQIDQLVDTLYFSYTISKAKGKVGDRSLKIVTKIIKEEMWARDNIKTEKNALWYSSSLPEKQYWSMSLLKVMIDLCKSKWKVINGENFTDQLNKRIAQEFARKRFSEIATLKASSKDYENPEINLPENMDGELTGHEYVKKLKELNPKMDGKRPRVISSLMKFIREYVEVTRDTNPTLLKSLEYSIKSLTKRGFIYSDCFPKDQHGGDREIHVLEIKARIVQFFVERSAWCMSFMFKSDTVLNPKRKDTFMKEHEMNAQATLGNHMTMCKSADATKWCQRHHVSKFYFAMNRLTDGVWNNLFYNAFYLWTVKRIAIPSELVSILDASKFPESDNKTLLWLKEKFISGETPFVGESTNTIEVKFGMFQGIFHRVSSVFHSIVQEFNSDMIRGQLRKRRMRGTVTVVQGSDDSACCISYSMVGNRADAFVHILLKWKEEFQKYVSIWPSESKSSIGTQLFIEYNSEWWYRGKVLKPTFRWVSACLETSIVETFYERMQIFYNGLTTAVEMGVSTLCASVIQKGQAWLHYLMMGFGNHILREHVSDLLLSSPHPSLGFFPLDGEEYCGITGFDYSLYVVHREWKIPVADYNKEMIHPSSLLDYDEKIDKSMRKDLKRVFVGYGNKRLWEKVVEEIDMGTLQDALDVIDKAPIKLYQEGNSWEDQRVHMILKLFQKGVRTSLSSYQPTIRSAASSSYLFNRPCVYTSLHEREKPNKVSLMKAILQSSSLLTPPTSPTHVMSGGQIQAVIPSNQGVPLFVNEQEYSDFYSYIEDLRKGFTFQEVPYGRHSKVSVPVWGEIHMNETPVIDICKRALFDINSVPISKTSFKVLWNDCKMKYRFLRDTYKETLNQSGLDHMQLHDFFQSASAKTRRVTLQDTSAKNPYLANSLSRIYWPQIKVRSQAQTLEENITNCRHMLMCATSFWFSRQHKMRVVKKIMDKSGIKKLKLAQCPNKAKRLKVICDFLMSGDKERALVDIPYVKNGVIGFFIRRQPKQRGNEGQIRYTGKGTWLGMVCGIPTKINIENESVHSVEVSSVQDTNSLSKRLYSLFSELRLSFPKVCSRSKSLYYLNQKGHFAISPIPLQDCTPVEEVRELTSPDFQALIGKEWDVEIENTNIRLYYVEQLGGGRDRKITLISDTFTSRDWCPEMTPADLSWTKSFVFSDYCKGNSVSVYNLLKDLSIEPSKEYVENLITRTKGLDHEVGIFSFSDMKKDLKHFIMRHYSSELERQEYLRTLLKAKMDERTDVIIDNNDIDELLKFGVEGMDIGKVMKDWAEEVQELEDSSDDALTFLHEVSIEDQKDEDFLSLDHALEDIQWSGESKMMEEMAELFYELDLEDLGITQKDLDMTRLMPLENQFWLDVVAMTKSEDSGDNIIKNITRGNAQDEKDFLISHAAFFVSLVAEKNLYSHRLVESSSFLEKSISSSTKEPIVTKGDLNKRIEETNKKISDLSNALQLSEGYVKELLSKKLSELSTQLEAYESNKNEIFSEDINYYEFMDTLLSEMKKEGIYDKTEQSTELEILITLLISDVLEQTINKNKIKAISDFDLNAVRSRIWDRVVSSGLIRAIANSFNLGIQVNFKGVEFYTHQPITSLTDIIVDIK